MNRYNGKELDSRSVTALIHACYRVVIQGARVVIAHACRFALSAEAVGDGTTNVASKHITAVHGGLLELQSGKRG